MTFFKFLRFCEAMQELGCFLAHFRARFLAAVLEISGESLRRVSFLHSAPLTSTLGMIVEVVLQCGFRLLLKSIKIIHVATQKRAPEVPLQATKASAKAQVEAGCGAIATPNARFPKHLSRCIKSAKNA